jgi:2-dehydro-3-deoxyglucarate aldolase/4-hydroxy-2-oxoheptanedioate aldolase
MISTAEQARAMVDSVKYFPAGKRGVGLQMAHDNYRSAPVADALRAANERTMVICLIETADGAKNVDAIAAVEGVDGLWVGHFDLSVSLGIPGDFAHPTFAVAMDGIIAAAKKHGKALGRLVPSVEQGIAFHKQGFDFICYSGDIWVLRDGLAAAGKAIREGVR